MSLEGEHVYVVRSDRGECSVYDNARTAIGSAREQADSRANAANGETMTQQMLDEIEGSIGTRVATDILYRATSADGAQWVEVLQRRVEASSRATERAMQNVMYEVRRARRGAA